MERNIAAGHRRSTYFAGRCMGSPSTACLKLIHDETEYSRIGDHNNIDEDHNSKTRSGKRLRKFIRRLILIKDCGISSNAKPLRLRFHYDAVSYSQNFDDGCHLHDESRISRDLRWGPVR